MVAIGSPTIRTTGVAFVALALAIGLGACTNSAVPTPAPTTTARVSTPSATAVPVDLSCGTQVPTALLDGWAPGLPLLPASNYDVAPPAPGLAPSARTELLGPLNPPSVIAVLGALRAGYFTCLWSIGDGSTSLRVSVLPDGAAAFHTELATFPHEIATFDGLPVGDQAAGGCSNQSSGGPFCAIHVLSGRTWISVSGSRPGIAAGGAKGLEHALLAVATNATAVVKAAGAAIEPTPVTDALGCSAITASVAVTDPTFNASGAGIPDMTDAYDDVFRAAVAQSGADQCAGGSGLIEMVPGLPTADPLTYGAGYTTTPVPVAISGIEGARDLCLPASQNGCWTEGFLGHTFIVARDFASITAGHNALAAIAASSASS